MSAPIPGPVVALGTDVVDIERFRSVLARTPGIADRCFSEGERELCARRRDPVPGLAARFAVKEAVLKVFGTGLGGAPMSEIEVVRAESGEPSLRLRGQAADRSDERRIGSWLVSMSHSELVALATVVALGRPLA